MGSSTATEQGARGQGSNGATEIESVRPFESLSLADVPYAGGKGASLGELTAPGLPVPG